MRTQPVLPKLWLVHWEDHKITLSLWILSHENPWFWANFLDLVVSKYHNIFFRLWVETITTVYYSGSKGLNWFRILGRKIKFFENMQERAKSYSHPEIGYKEKGLYVNIFISMLGYVWGIDFHKYYWNNLRMFMLLVGDISQHYK